MTDILEQKIREAIDSLLLEENNNLVCTLAKDSKSLSEWTEKLVKQALEDSKDWSEQQKLSFSEQYLNLEPVYPVGDFITQIYDVFDFENWDTVGEMIHDVILANIDCYMKFDETTI